MPKRSGRGKSKNIIVSFFDKIISLCIFIWKSVPVLIIAGIFYFSFFSVKDLLSADAYFQIASLKIFPRGILTEQEYQALERRSTGVNLLKADLRKLTAMIEKNPKVRQASVIRKLPNELEIFLTPRKAARQLKTSPRGAYYTLGEDGIVMAVSDVRDPALLQLLHFDYPVKKFALLDRYQDAALRKLDSVINALSQNDATKKEKISTVSVDKTGSFSVAFSDGVEILLRDTGDLTNQKMMALGNLLQSEERQLIAYIDLRHLDIILKYK